MADFAQVVLGGAALGVGACFHDAGPGSDAKTSVRRHAVKPTGRLRRASADVARETFRSTPPQHAQKKAPAPINRVLLPYERCRHRRPHPSGSPYRRVWCLEPDHLIEASDVSLGAAVSPNPGRLAALLKSPRTG